jgi:hypothetical protein
VVTLRSIPISEFRKEIDSEEKEIKLWHYMGPSIIQLLPDSFSRLQQLTPIQMKALLKESKYSIYEKGQKISIDNGGILFEGTIEEKVAGGIDGHMDSSLKSESEKGFDHRTIKIKAYAFIYPTESNYIAE